MATYQNYDFWLNNSLLTPPLEVKGLNHYFTNTKFNFTQNKITPKRMYYACSTLNKKNNYIKYKIIHDNFVIFLPPCRRFFYRKFFEYPQITSIFSEKGGGKTITAWTMGMEFLDHFPDGELYVYGDIDNLGGKIQSKYPNRIHIHDNYMQLPPDDDRKKLIIYNELSREIISKRATTNDNLELNLQALRTRHKNIWQVFNIIRFTSMESVLRDTASIKVFKWLTPELLYNIINAISFPPAYSQILFLTLKMHVNEGICFFPVKAKGTYLFLLKTNPPDWLLKL